MRAVSRAAGNPRTMQSDMQEERPYRDAPHSGAARSESLLLALSSNKDLLVGDAGFEPATSSV